MSQSAAQESQPPADEPKSEQQTPAEGDPANESKPAVVESTEEEFAHAATKIGAAFRGKKAREEVAQIKAQKEAEKAQESVPEV